MTPDEALAYCVRYGARAAKLARMSVTALSILDVRLMQAAGRERLYGTLSKDELAAEILSLEFPDIAEADRIRVQAALEET